MFFKLFNKPKDDLPFMTPFHDNKGTISLVLGSPGSGKSFFAKELAIKYLINSCPVVIVNSKDHYSRHLGEYMPLVNYFKDSCSIQTADNIMNNIKPDRKNLVIFDESYRGINQEVLLRLVEDAKDNNIDILFITQHISGLNNDKVLTDLSFNYIFVFELQGNNHAAFSGLLSPEEINYAYSTLDTIRGKYSRSYVKGKDSCCGRVKKIKPSRFNLRLIDDEVDDSILFWVQGANSSGENEECQERNADISIHNQVKMIIDNIPEKMTEARKEAYIRLFERSYSLLRTSSFRALNNPDNAEWFLELVMQITEIFHNLPQFLVNDFEGFNEEMFWQTFLNRDEWWVNRYCDDLLFYFLDYLEKVGEGINLT